MYIYPPLPAQLQGGPEEGLTACWIATTSNFWEGSLLCERSGVDGAGAASVLGRM